MAIHCTFDEELSAQIRQTAARDEVSVNAVIQAAVTMFMHLSAAIAERQHLEVEIQDAHDRRIATLIIIPADPENPEISN